MVLRFEPCPFFDGIIYVGGGFGVIGGQLRNNLTAFETSTGNATDWNPNANAYVNTLRVANEQVYVSGRFSTIGEKERQRLRVQTQDNPYFNLLQTPTVILPTSEAIYIAGELFSHGKVLGAGFAIVNLDGSLR